MAGKYETVRPPRFEVEQGLGGERIRVRARRNLFMLLFLPFWLIVWTGGGIAAAAEFARTGEPFLALWLCGWALGWIFAVLMLAWMLAGAELIGVNAGDLEIEQSLFGLTRRRLYCGRDVRNLSPAPAPPFFAQAQISLPFLMRSRFGAVKFNYGGRTVYAAQGLDEAEGRMIVDRLLRHLPPGAGS
ncbi:MAG TPA: hypothetical protein VGW40_08595 [Allosphingosinicella sp.]|nr:hypothetical protein [Allosphingosinicella sp.]